MYTVYPNYCERNKECVQQTLLVRVARNTPELNTRTQTTTFKPDLESQIGVFRDLKCQTSNLNFILRVSQAGVVQPVLRSQASN